MPRPPALPLLLLLCTPATAQQVRDLDPHVRVEASTAPPRLRLRRDPVPGTRSFTVLRRETPDRPFAALAPDLPGDATGFDDQ